MSFWRFLKKNKMHKEPVVSDTTNIIGRHPVRVKNDFHNEDRFSWLKFPVTKRAYKRMTTCDNPDCQCKTDIFYCTKTGEWVKLLEEELV